MNKKISAILIFALFFQIISLSFNPASVHAAEIITQKGYAVNAITTAGKYYLYLFGEDGKTYLLQRTNGSFNSFKNKWVEFSGEVLPSQDNNHILLNFKSINEVNISELTNIEYINARGELSPKFDSKGDANLRKNIYNFKRDNGVSYLVYAFSDFTDTSKLNEHSFKNQNILLEGYYVKDTNMVIAYSIVSLGTNDDQVDIPSNFYYGTKTLRLTNRISNYANQQQYNFYFTEPGSPNGNFKLVFDKTKLISPMPTSNLSGNEIYATFYYDPQSTENIKSVYVTEWALKKNDNEITGSYRILTLKAENNDYVTYGVYSYDNNVVQYLKFTKSVLGSSYPSESLIGKDVVIVGTTLQEDYSEVQVTKWFEASRSQETYTPEETTTEHGILVELLDYERRSDNVVLKSLYVLRNFDGEEFLVYFDRNDVRNLPGIDREGANVTVEGVIKGKDGHRPIIVAKSITYNNNSYSYYKNEIVAVDGQIYEKIESESSDTQHVYRFITKNEREYYAIFDESVLGSVHSISIGINKNLKLFGVSYTVDGKSYIGVFSYADLDEDDKGFPVYGLDGKEYMGLELTVTPVRLISESEGIVVYEVITSDGNIKSVIFNKEVLGDHMPKQHVIGTTLNIFVLKESNSSISMVVSWYESHNELTKNVKGTFIDVIDEYTSASVFEFKTVDGAEIEVVVPKDMFSSSTLKGKNGIIFGKFTMHESKLRFVLQGFNEIPDKIIDRKTADQIVFRGTVKEIVNETERGITYFAENAYNQFALLYFDKFELGSDYPSKSLIGKEIVVNGIMYDNGVVYVLSYNQDKIPKEYPNPIQSLYEEKEYYPNMKGFTGLLSILTIDTSRYILTTPYDTFILEGNQKVIKEIEKNLGKIVYLRGEQSEAGDPYWTGKIKVYDIKPISNQKDVIIKPKNKPVPEMIKDPFKDAIHTIQINYIPKNFPYGDAIEQSLYLPSKNDDNGK